MEYEFYCPKCDDRVTSNVKYKVFGEQIDHNANFYIIHLCQKHHDELLTFFGMDGNRK